MIKIPTILIITSLTVVTCRNSHPQCGIREGRFDGEIFKTDGCLINNLEEGEWRFYNSDGSEYERGIFEHGIRKGMWRYPNTRDSTFDWKKFVSPSLSLVFNIPTQLKLVTDTLVNDTIDYVKFTNDNDQSKLFNLSLSVFDIKVTNKTIESYYELGEEEIKNRGWKFTDRRTEIKTEKTLLYFNEYLISDSDASNFKVLNMYRLMSDGKIMEISCRFTDQIERTSRMIFTSVIANSFYKSERFLDPWEGVKATNK